MNNPHHFDWRQFETPAALDESLADDVATALTSAIADRGKAVLVVSGGSTPLNFFQVLSQKTLPWEKVIVTLADERWVDPAHPDSNERLVRERLLINAAGAATFLPLKTSHDDGVGAEAELDSRLSELGTFDIVILGMGGDGHTASLFPEAPQLSQAMDMTSSRQCIAVDPVTAPHQRMSLTLPRLLNSRKVIVHVVGVEKKSVLETAIAETGSIKLPIASITGQNRVPTTVYWSG
ncbi:MAG: 6-phosphogluconolactonase [bacterium]